MLTEGNCEVVRIILVVLLQVFDVKTVTVCVLADSKLGVHKKETDKMRDQWGLDLHLPLWTAWVLSLAHSIPLLLHVLD